MSIFNREAYYSQQEMDDMRSILQDALKQERQRADIACEAVGKLAEQVHLKKKKIERLEYYLEVLTRALNVSGEMLREMRDSENKKAGM